MTAVATSQRVSHTRHCLVCDGWPEAPKGRRCWGFIGADAKAAHCTRPELAGLLERGKDGAFAHWLIGHCRCGQVHGQAPRAVELPAVSSDDDTRRQEWAREVWDRAARAQGTIVEVYLRSRGIAIAPPDALRFGWDKHTESGGRLPVMIGAVRHVAGDGVQGVHRTYLAMDGLGKAAVIPNKKMIGATAGGAVRLAQAGETLVVGEGVETCLSVMQATGLPAWAALSAGGIERVVLPPLPLAARVVIAADRDPVGERAAHLAAERLVAEGRHVRIALPPEPHNDFNDLARSEASV